MIETGLYDQEEIYTDCTVQILTNSKTGEQSIGWWDNKEPPFDFLKCPFCGNRLSNIRVQNGKLLRHCFSCHFEWEVKSSNEDI